jgi:RimJ/RimL family protein N-acetyltransferase
LIIPTLRTPRLLPCHQLFDDIAWSDLTLSDTERLERRRSWIAWLIDCEREFDRLLQPSYGERAIVWRETGAFIGLVGMVPSFGPFGQLPSFGAQSGARFTAEVGLFWAVSPARQRTGVATEAAGALIEHLFGAQNVGRVIATTDNDNLASQAVMRRLGMTLERNPWPGPPWFQTVGRLDAGAR